MMMAVVQQLWHNFNDFAFQLCVHTGNFIEACVEEDEENAASTIPLEITELDMKMARDDNALSIVDDYMVRVNELRNTTWVKFDRIGNNEDAGDIIDNYQAELLLLDTQLQKRLHSKVIHIEKGKLKLLNFQKYSNWEEQVLCHSNHVLPDYQPNETLVVDAKHDCKVHPNFMPELDE